MFSCIDPGDEFFIIKIGEVLVTTTAGSGEVEVGTLGSGEYFGEQALLNDAPRAANVKCKGDVTLFVLNRNKFEEILGPLSAVIERVMKERTDQVNELVGKRVMDSNIAFSDLKILRTLGTGTFGRVKLVQNTKTQKVYALKCLQKAQIVAYKQVKSNYVSSPRAVLLLSHLSLFLSIYVSQFYFSPPPPPTSLSLLIK